MSTGRWVSVAAGIVVVATLVAAIALMDSPAQQREQRLDARRVQDLQRIEHAVASYQQQHETMPRDMQAIAALPGWSLAVVDPESGQPYAYDATGGRGFRLCASFGTDSADGEQQPRTADDWNHPAGPHCFIREVPAD